jgi:hypothetical protein
MRKIKKMDDAVVGIIAAFLITGLIVIVISLIQTVYIPKWMEQNEADHMDVVSDQFSQLKFAIDTQSALQQPNIPISTSITLGNKEMPFLMSSRSYGSLDILHDKCVVTITNDDTETYSYPLGVIKYSSVNSYFLNQEYIYEAGALILSQSEGNTMSIRPAFSVYNGGDEINISFTLINITTDGKQQSISGYGNYPIQTECLDPNPVTPIPIVNVSNIKITTTYPNSWLKFIKNTLINAGLKYDDNPDFSIDIVNNTVSVAFLDHTTQTNANIRVIEIGAQISPGRIENIR